MPGAGDSFYCGNCFRDNLQAQALRRAGHEVCIMPLYLPFTQAELQADTPLFFPATSYYIEQRFFEDKGMPRWIKNITGSARALKFASSLSGSTSAEGSEGMTISMISGIDAAFRRQMEELIAYVREDGVPDVIHLSSTLLLGVARVIKETLDVRLVCSMQDEEVWIDSMKMEYAKMAWLLMRENLKCVDHFICTSHYYEQFMLRKMPELSGKTSVVYPGIQLSRYMHPELTPTHPTIGFFYRMNELDGLDILVDAFILMKKDNRWADLRLKVGGGYTSKNRKFVNAMKRRLSPYADFVEFMDDYHLSQHSTFYASCSLTCVPLRFNESVGLYLCESFAAGIPVVEPNTGSFPEIVGEAGILFSPNDSVTLAKALERAFNNLPELQPKARETALKHYNDTTMAEQLLAIYEAQIEKKPFNTKTT